MGSSQQLYSLSWGEFGACLSSTVQVLRGHGDLIDVTLAAGGKIFPAHKLVLSAASPLLMELLKSTQCQHPVVMLAGIASADLEAILQFIYQGEVSVNPNQLPSLLQAAQCLDIQALSPATYSTLDKLSHSVFNPNHDSLSRGALNSGLSGRKKKRKARSDVDRNPSTSDGSVMPNESKDQDKGSEEKKASLVSDLPVSCNICGVTLRQSRNLRRHMELIHLKPENGLIVCKKKVKKNDSSQNNGVSSSLTSENSEVLNNRPPNSSFSAIGDSHPGQPHAQAPSQQSALPTSPSLPAHIPTYHQPNPAIPSSTSSSIGPSGLLSHHHPLSIPSFSHPSINHTHPIPSTSQPPHIPFPSHTDFRQQPPDILQGSNIYSDPRSHVRPSNAHT